MASQNTPKNLDNLIFMGDYDEMPRVVKMAIEQLGDIMARYRNAYERAPYLEERLPSLSLLLKFALSFFCCQSIASLLERPWVGIALEMLVACLFAAQFYPYEKRAHASHTSLKKRAESIWSYPDEQGRLDRESGESLPDPIPTIREIHACYRHFLTTEKLSAEFMALDEDTQIRVLVIRTIFVCLCLSKRYSTSPSIHS